MPDDYKFSEHSLFYRKFLEGDALRAFGKFVGLPVRMLEIGVYEGGSAAWFLDNILTHEQSVYMGVDDNLREIAIRNLSVHQPKVSLYNEESNQFLPTIIDVGIENFDMVYIDGCHKVSYTLNDIRNSLQMLNVGGVIMIDDYLHEEYKLRLPIDLFLKNRNDVKVLFTSDRIAIEKV